MNLNSYRMYRVLLLMVGFSSLVLLIQLTNKYRVRWDLTEEKRFTVSDAGKEVLRNLEEPVSVECYLAGTLPSNFKRFKKAIQDMLDQLALYADNKIQYRFTDPSQAKSGKARNEFYRSLIDKGFQPTNLTVVKNHRKNEQLVFPGLLLTYKGKEAVVPLLRGSRAALPEEMINQSIEGLEYEIISHLKSLMQNSRKRIALITGHYEPDTGRMAGFTNAVLEEYDLFRINLKNRKRPIVGYDAVIIAKPKTSFSEREKYLIDQYIMNGGSLLAFTDALKVNVREAEGEGTVALPYELNLEDMFFRYGVRINRDYVLDYHSGFFPGVLGNIGDQPKIELMPWPFFPVATHYGSHPMTRGLDASVFKFASTIDTVKAVGITKTPIVYSSRYTHVMTPPVQVRFDDWVAGLNPKFFKSGAKPLGYLLEGKFTSLYQNRIPPRGVDRTAFKAKGEAAKIIVIGDGDFIGNDFNPSSGEPLAMGVDPYVRTTYANEDFLMRALAYLTDDSGLVLTRNKEIKIRPLDRVRIGEEKNFWIILNTVVPVLIVLVFGVVKYGVRKRRFNI